MPQMAPLMWLILYFYFILMFWLVLSIIFFSSSRAYLKPLNKSDKGEKSFFWLW